MVNLKFHIFYQYDKNKIFKTLAFLYKTNDLKKTYIIVKVTFQWFYWIRIDENSLKVLEEKKNQ